MRRVKELLLVKEAELERLACEYSMAAFKTVSRLFLQRGFPSLTFPPAARPGRPGERFGDAL